MKKLMIAIMLCLPMAGMAQNQWERPDIQEKKAVKTEKEVTTEDPKYLEGAVPVVNGEVCWTLDLSVPGKNAQQIYDLVPWTGPFAQWLLNAGYVETRRQHLLSIDWNDPAAVPR